PFTAPGVALVRLSIGFTEGQGFQLYISAFVLLISTIFGLILSARIYKNGILATGHRLRIAQVWRWLKKK
ncbi:MAG: ABC transporter permease, partial [Bacteroidetes bacterium]|nr:ABC transporter permease [Bacteroidota bacterium]